MWVPFSRTRIYAKKYIITNNHEYECHKMYLRSCTKKCTWKFVLEYMHLKTYTCVHVLENWYLSTHSWKLVVKNCTRVHVLENMYVSAYVYLKHMYMQLKTVNSTYTWKHVLENLTSNICTLYFYSSTYIYLKTYSYLYLKIWKHMETYFGYDYSISKKKYEYNKIYLEVICLSTFGACT